MNKNKCKITCVDLLELIGGFNAVQEGFPEGVKI